MPEEKVKCEYCGRRNSVDNDLCLSCGAWLRITFPIPSASEWDLSYLNLLAKHSGFTYDGHRLVGVR